MKFLNFLVALGHIHLLQSLSCSMVKTPMRSGSGWIIFGNLEQLSNTNIVFLHCTHCISYWSFGGAETEDFMSIGCNLYLIQERKLSWDDWSNNVCGRLLLNCLMLGCMLILSLLVLESCCCVADIWRGDSSNSSWSYMPVSSPISTPPNTLAVRIYYDSRTSTSRPAVSMSFVTINCMCLTPFLKFTFK